jgi:molecular chaperone Hsp33
MSCLAERLDVAQLHPDWGHVAALAATTSAAELTDPALEPEAFLWRLFHEEEVRVTAGVAPWRGCRCNEAHIRSVLEGFPEAERADMRGADGLISVDCKFCSKIFAIAA